MHTKSSFPMISLIHLLGLLGFLAFSSGTFATPNIEQWQTKNGAKVLFFSTPNLPIVDVRVIFDAGSARDHGKDGLAVMTSRMLSAGAGNRSEEQIAETIDDLAISLGASALRDMALVSLRSLSDREILDPALTLMTDLINSPSFDTMVFERERKRTLIGLQGEKQQIGTVASKAFYRALYGDHPYASHSRGTKETVSALTRDELVKFHQTYFVGNNAIVAIVGDLDRKNAEKIAEQVVGQLPVGRHAADIPVPALPTDAKKGEQVHLSHPSQQTHILIGHPAVKRGDDDYFELYVGNHILGGSGFNSRIMQEIREDRGLAYSAYSYFSPMRGLGPFQAGLQTRNDQRDEALNVLQKVIADFIADGPTEEELERSKKNIIGGFPLRIDSNKKIVEYLGMIAFYGLPIDHLDTFNSKIEEVTVDAIRDAFQRRLHLEKMAVVVVGGGL